MKFLFIIFCLTTFSMNGLTFSKVHAQDFIDTLIFAQLPQAEQHKLIITSQKLAANLEHVQNQDYVKRRNKKQRYSSVQFLLKLLINDSYAEFLGTKNDKLCIYAGWISYMVNGHCTHPINLKAKSGEYAKKTYDEYEELMDKCKNPGGKAGMVCSPHLFGTKLSGKPFCSTGNEDPFNSSFKCMKVARAYAKDPKEDLAKDSNGDFFSQDVINKKILDGIVALALNDKEAKGLQSLPMLFQLNYDICMCKGESEFINKKYAEDMFAERTCYSWLIQTRLIIENLDTNSCKELSSLQYDKHENNPFNIAKMDDWVNKAEGIIDAELIDSNGKQIEAIYFTGTDQDDVKWSGREVNDTKCPIKFTIDIDAKKSDNNKTSVLVTAHILGLEKTNSSDKDWKFSDLEEKNADDRASAAKNAQYYKLVDGPYSITVSLEDYGSVEVTIPAIDHNTSSGDCSITAEENTEESVTTADVDLTGRKLTLTAVGIDNFSDPKKIKVIWTKANPDPESNNEAIAYAIIKEGTVTAQFTHEGINYSCSETLTVEEEVVEEEDKDNKKYTINLELTDNDTDADIKATVTITGVEGDAKESDMKDAGLKIVWTVKDKEESSDDDDDDDDNESAGVDDSEENAADTDSETISTGTKLSVSRDKTSKEQVVTAKLMKGDVEKGVAEEVVAALKKEQKYQEKKAFNPQVQTPTPQPFSQRNRGTLRGTR